MAFNANKAKALYSQMKTVWITGDKSMNLLPWHSSCDYGIAPKKTHSKQFGKWIRTSMYVRYRTVVSQKWFKSELRYLFFRLMTLDVKEVNLWASRGILFSKMIFYLQYKSMIYHWSQKQSHYFYILYVLTKAANWDTIFTSFTVTTFEQRKPTIRIGLRLLENALNVSKLWSDPLAVWFTAALGEE